ncbi:MAG TPA: hypothetical protein VGM96_19020 [Reyranella sp.]
MKTALACFALLLALPVMDAAIDTPANGQADTARSVMALKALLHPAPDAAAHRPHGVASVCAGAAGAPLCRSELTARN